MRIYLEFLVVALVIGLCLKVLTAMPSQAEIRTFISQGVK